MRLIITDIEYIHKYAYFKYDVYDDNNNKIDNYQFQYCFENNKIGEEEIRQVMRNCLNGYKAALENKKIDRLKKYIGLSEVL